MLFRLAMSTKRRSESFPWTSKVFDSNFLRILYVNAVNPAIAELRDTGKFDDLSHQADEDEHSIEMHLPYVRKIFEG